jgi:hypothetical protein
MRQDGFSNAADDDERIKSIEHGNEVSQKTDGIEFDEHFNGEQYDKTNIG